MRKLICVLMVLMLLAGTAHALTGEWDAIARIPENENAYLVRRDGLWGMIDGEGKVRIKPMFDKEPVFIGGYAEVSVPDPNPREGFSGEEVYGSFLGIISDTGEFLLKPEFTELRRSADGMMIRYELGGTHHFLNLETGKKLPGSYDRAYDFTGDYAVVGMKGAQVDKNLSAPEVIHWGTIDRNGKTGIHMGYDYLELNENGVAIVKLADKYGFVRADGKELTRCRYDGADPFRNGVSFVTKIIGKNEPGKDSDPYLRGWGAVDEEGNEILPCEYDHLVFNPDGIIIAQLGDGYLLFEARDGKAVPIDKGSINP